MDAKRPGKKTTIQVHNGRVEKKARPLLCERAMSNSTGLISCGQSRKNISEHGKLDGAF